VADDVGREARGSSLVLALPEFDPERLAEICLV
jgi:hypothetical protein